MIIHSPQTAVKTSRHPMSQRIHGAEGNGFGRRTHVATAEFAAWQLKARIDVGMAGIKVPIPLPMAFDACGDWKNGCFCDLDFRGPEGVECRARTKAVTARRNLGKTADPGLMELQP